MIDHDDESIARSRALSEHLSTMCATRADRLHHPRQRAYADACNAFHRAEEDLHQRSISLPWSTDRRVANAIYTHWFEGSEKERWFRILHEEESQLLRWTADEMRRRHLDDTTDAALVRRAVAGQTQADQLLEAICMALNL